MSFFYRKKAYNMTNCDRHTAQYSLVLFLRYSMVFEIREFVKFIIAKVLSIAFTTLAFHYIFFPRTLFITGTYIRLLKTMFIQSFYLFHNKKNLAK